MPNKRPGAKALSVPADSAKIAGVEQLLAKVKETTDHIDILFANAGATWGEKFDTHPDSAFAKVMDLNVKSVFNTIRLYVKPCVASSPKRRHKFGSVFLQGRGRLSHIASDSLHFCRKMLQSKIRLAS